jgi:hypothetical protein
LSIWNRLTNAQLAVGGLMAQYPSFPPILSSGRGFIPLLMRRVFTPLLVRRVFAPLLVRKVFTVQAVLFVGVGLY